MEEALEILWTYARREPLDSNGETVVPTINNSIAAIRIIMRLEGWGSEKRKMNSEKRATHNKPASHRRGKVRESGVCEQFAQTKFVQPDTDNNNDDNYFDEYTDGELPNMGELPFAPTPAQPKYPQHNTAHNNYACLVAPSPSERGLGERNLLSFTRHTLPSFAPAPFHLAYYEVLTRFAMGEIKKLMITMPPQHGKSEGATRRLPAFVLGQDPDKRIAIVSYNAIKARKFNRELQRIMDDDRYYELFPQTLLAGQASYQEQGRRSRNYARNSDECEIVGYQGSFKTIGVGGSLTGEPVDMLIMDDLYKDASSAWSPVIR
ncbi:hypothetical protein HMPREF1154_2241, partial [Capnocytophaga sp. CM59]